MKGIQAEQFAATLNHTIKELNRRQKHSTDEFDKIAQQFIKQQEKKSQLETFQPIIDITNNIIKWMLDRLEPAFNFTEQIITQKKTYQTIVQQERNTCLEIYKLDLSKLNTIRQQFFQFTTYLKNGFQKEITEYQLLYQICNELNVDFPQFLTATLKLEDSKNLLLSTFKNQNKERGFIYQFYLKFAKRKVIYFEEAKFVCESLKKLLSVLERNSFGVVNMIQNDHTLTNEEYLVDLQRVIEFHVEIHQELLFIINKLIKLVDQEYELIKNKYTKYIMIVLQMQRMCQQTCFHDDLMTQLSLTLADMIKVNIVRDKCYISLIVDLGEFIQLKINQLNTKINIIIKSTVQKIGTVKLQNSFQGEQQWNEMLQKEKDNYQKQSKEYENILQFRKQAYLKQDDRYCNNPKIVNFPSIELKITVKEFFKLFLSCEEPNFFVEFKKNILKQIQIQCTKYEPMPPKMFLQEENLNLKEIIDHLSASKRVITFKSINQDKLKFFSSEFIHQKCEQFVYFISDQEIMLEEEEFSELSQNTIRRYIHIIHLSQSECRMNYGYFKYERSRFNILGILEYFQTTYEKEIYEQLTQAVQKQCDIYFQNKDHLQEERKKEFILNNNIHYMLNEHTNKPIIQQKLPFINMNQNKSNQWSLTQFVSQENLMKIIFLLLLLNFFKPHFS